MYTHITPALLLSCRRTSSPRRWTAPAMYICVLCTWGIYVYIGLILNLPHGR